MKLLLINSSARFGGNTARVMNLFAESLDAVSREKKIDLELVRVNLAQKNLLSCLGCRVCFDRGESFCPRKDDLLPLRDEMLSADGYLIASPVYVEDVSGVMKTLIDRMAFQSHRPALYGKSALFFVTSGIGASNHAINTMRTAFGTWGVKAAHAMKFRLGAIRTEDEIRAEYGTAIRTAAETFLCQMLQSPFRPSLYSMIAFSVQQTLWRRTTEQDTVDYRYWSESGWLDRDRLYYDATCKRSFRLVFAHVLGRIIALFFG